MRLDDSILAPAGHASLCSSAMPDWACTSLDLAVAVLASSFTLALLGALTGAAGGAIAAVRIVERRKLRDELVKEIRNTNAAIMVCLAICNKALVLKKQHVLPLRAKFAADHAAFAEFIRQRRTGERQGNAVPQIAVDFRTVPGLTFSTGTLQSLMFGKISITGRALALMTTLTETATWLAAANAKRNELLERMKRSAPGAPELPALYFGTPSPTGQTNREYPETVLSVASHTDELIFFSSTLCNDLLAHGQELRATFIRRFGKKDAPGVNGVDFSADREAGLMPSDTAFSEWLNGLGGQVAAGTRD
jgi:hypothetical protein